MLSHKSSQVGWANGFIVCPRGTLNIGGQTKGLAHPAPDRLQSQQAAAFQAFYPAQLHRPRQWVRHAGGLTPFPPIAPARPFVRGWPARPP